MTFRTREAALALWLLAAAVAIFVPFSPGLPAAGLDAAWVYGLNEATAQRLAFGREMIFTYGPYSAVYTRAYHPGTHTLAVAASLYLGIWYAAALVGLMRFSQQRWHLALLALLCGTLWFVRDPVVLSVPLLAAICIARIASPDPSPGRASHRRWPLPITAWLFAPLGLLPLIKGSLGIFCLGVVLLSALFLLLQHRARLAATCVLAPMVSMVGFWLASGQSLPDLPGYFAHMLPIVSGYTDAMSGMGDNRQALAFVVCGILMLWALAHDGSRWRETGLNRLYLLGAFGLFLFLSFKGIYVRHDLWRGLSGGTTLLLTMLLMRSASARRRFWPVLLVGVLGFAYIDRKGFTTPDIFTAGKLVDSYAYVLREARARLQEPGIVQRLYEEALATMRAGTPLPRLPGSVDLFPSEQGVLVASGNHWNPRPILQSYSAYTPLLAELNRQHLSGDSAPEHLFFKVDALDGRVPSLDDGPSWPTLLQRYQPRAMQGEYLLLDRRADPAPVRAAEPLAPVEGQLGQWVDVPAKQGALMVQMQIRPTLYGRLALLLFKPTQLRIDLELADGAQASYRLIATMARAGFLLSPLTRDVTDFTMLYGDPALLEGNAVRRLRVHPLREPDRIWQGRYTIDFRPLQRPAPLDLSALLRVNRSFDAPAGVVVTPAPHCDGSIDLIRGAPPQRPPAVNRAGPRLPAAGWLVASSSAGTLPDESLLVFEDPDGGRRFAATSVSQRPDVAAHFNRPALAASGWRAEVDTTGLRGRYKLGLGWRSGQTLWVCPEGGVLIDLEAAATAEPAVRR